jgi:hypothetical protein
LGHETRCNTYFVTTPKFEYTLFKPLKTRESEFLIRPPEFSTRHALPQLKPCQVRLMMAGPRLVEVQNRCQAPPPLVTSEKDVVLVKVFVTEAGALHGQKERPPFLQRRAEQIAQARAPDDRPRVCL